MLLSKEDMVARFSSGSETTDMQLPIVVLLVVGNSGETLEIAKQTLESNAGVASWSWS